MYKQVTGESCAELREKYINFTLLGLYRKLIGMFVLHLSLCLCMRYAFREICVPQPIDSTHIEEKKMLLAG